MDSRMDKYKTPETNTSSRTDKNKRLYEEVSDINVDYINLDDNAIELTSIKNTRSDYQKQREIDSAVQVKEVSEILEEVPIKNDRIYDINEILRKAKEEQKLEEKKRLINTEYNILTKLNIDEIDNKDLKKENIKEIIDTVYPKEEKDDNNKDLFEDMIEIETDIDEEEFTRDVLNLQVEDIVIKDEVIEKNKSEMETEDTLTTTTEIMKTKKTKGPIIFLVIFVILIILVGAYFLLKYFGTI